MPRYVIEFSCPEDELEDTLGRMAVDGFWGVLKEVDEPSLDLDHSVNCSRCSELVDERESITQEEGSVCKACISLLTESEKYGDEWQKKPRLVFKKKDLLEAIDRADDNDDVLIMLDDEETVNGVSSLTEDFYPFFVDIVRVDDDLNEIRLVLKESNFTRQEQNNGN